MPFCVQVEGKCFHVCLKWTTEVIADLSHPVPFVLHMAGKRKEEWVRPEVESQPPEQSLRPLSIGLRPSASEHPEFIQRAIRCCFSRIVLLVIYMLLAISRWLKSTREEYSDAESKGMRPFLRAAPLLVSAPWNHMLKCKCSSLPVWAGTVSVLKNWTFRVSFTLAFREVDKQNKILFA